MRTLYLYMSKRFIHFMIIFEQNFHPSIDGFPKNTIIVKFQKKNLSIDGSSILVKLSKKYYRTIWKL